MHTHHRGSTLAIEVLAAVALAALALLALAPSLPGHAQQPPFPTEPPIVIDPPWWPQAPQAQLDRFEVDAEVRDGHVVASYRFLLSNPGWDGPRPLIERPLPSAGGAAEARIVVPVPPSSSVTDLLLAGGPETLEGALLDADEAQRIYEDIVRRLIDPALLRSLGGDLFEVRAFPIPPGETREVSFVVTSPLTVDAGSALVELPWSRMSPRPASALVTVDVDVPWEVRAALAPGHDLDRTRLGPGRLELGWESPAGWNAEQDFRLHLTGGEGLVDTRLLAYREPGDDGYFSLLFTPVIDTDAAVARDVVLVLDVSGSMQGAKIEQARAAATYILERLGDEDRFGVVAFARRVETFEDGLRPARDADDAIDYVQRLEAAGGTNFAGALEAALDSLSGDRPSTVIVLTDGLPTVGLTDAGSIFELATELAPARTQVFAFGVGHDVDTVLLDGLATNFTGTSHYVSPEERVDTEVSRLYERISTPVLTDVEVEVQGVTVFDFAPRCLGGLFADSQTVLSGRYEATGPATVTVTGNGPEGRVRLVYEVSFPARDLEDPAVAQMWAQRFVADLLTDLRVAGPTPELIEEIVEVATRFGIVTPYTAYLAREPELAFAPGAAREALADAAAAVPPSGAEAFGGASDVETLRSGALPGGDSAAVRRVGAHSFYFVDGVWVQDGYPEAATRIEVTIGSPEFADLVRDWPDTAAAAALGERAVLEVDGVWIELVWPAPDASVSPVPTSLEVTPGIEGARPAVALPGAVDPIEAAEPSDSALTTVAVTAGALTLASALALGAFAVRRRQA